MKNAILMKKKSVKNKETCIQPKYIFMLLHCALSKYINVLLFKCACKIVDRAGIRVDNNKYVFVDELVRFYRYLQ